MLESGLGLRNNNLKEEWFVDSQDGLKKVKKGDLIFPPRKVWMKTFGCQMNYHDTERILAHLGNLNFSRTQDLVDADLVLFNTCAVRDLANQKFYSHLGEIKHIKKDNQGLVVGMGGCVAQTEGKALMKKYKHLDFAYGTDVIDTINDMVYRTYAGESKFMVNSWDRSSNFSIETKINHGTPQAFVNIIKGCNKYCSYCIVPYTRGKEKSRKMAEIVADVTKLVKYQGIQEVTLLGQNVNSFGKENGESLAGLLTELDKIVGLELIRYTTSHPYDVSDELIAAHGTLKKLSNHLHLPVQSGSKTVLERMLREYTPEHFLELCRKLRAANPNIVISSDIIVGFVDETEDEHNATLDLLEAAQFDFIYSYTYSKRNKTRAADYTDSLDPKVKSTRLRQLQAFQLEIQAKSRVKLVGQKFTVLVEGTTNMKGIKKWKGRTNCNRITHFLPLEETANYLWNWVDVEITEASALSCQAKIIKVHGKNLQQ